MEDNVSLRRVRPTDCGDILDASVAIRSKISLTNEFKIAMALFEIPVSGCTCLSTETRQVVRLSTHACLVTITDPCKCKKNRSPCATFVVSSLGRR